MPNYVDGVKSKAQSLLNERYRSPEMRDKLPGSFAAFQRNTPFTIPNENELRERPQRAVETSFLTRSKKTIRTARTHDHTGELGDAAKVDLSWATVAQDRRTHLKMGEGNLHSDAAMLANQIENALKDIREDISAKSLAFLGTNKTQVNTASALGAFNGTTFVWENPLSAIEDPGLNLKSMLRQNYYNGMVDLIADPVLAARIMKQGAQGTGNQTNLGYQFNDMMMNEAVGLSDGTYNNGYGYAIPEGTIGMTTWIPQKNRQGFGDFNSFVGGYGTIIDPLTGIEIAVHAYAQRADTSASNGDSQDVVIEWEFSTDVSFVKAPITVADETTIFAFGQLSA